MIRSFPPHPNPLPPGEREGHSSPQQSWGVFWHILIKMTKTKAVSKFGFSICFGFRYSNFGFKKNSSAHHHEDPSSCLSSVLGLLEGPHTCRPLNRRDRAREVRAGL